MFIIMLEVIINQITMLEPRIKINLILGHLTTKTQNKKTTK